MEIGLYIYIYITNFLHYIEEYQLTHFSALIATISKLRKYTV